MAGEGERILVVEDDLAISEGLQLNLTLEGYRVYAARNLAGGLEVARRDRPDLIVLDLMLPDGSGLELLRAVRREEQLGETRILILTARGLETEKVTGLRLGADDYITKPFSLVELLARVDAALRRERLRRRALLRFGEVEIDQERRIVRRRGRLVRLTRREYELLLLLARHPGRVFSREQLLGAVWGMDYEGTARTTDNFVRALRTKIEVDPTNPQHIVTVHGVGYRLDPGG